MIYYIYGNFVSNVSNQNIAKKRRKTKNKTNNKRTNKVI